MQSPTSDYIFRHQLRELNGALLERSAMLMRQAGCTVEAEAISPLRLLLGRGDASPVSSALVTRSRPAEQAPPPQPPYREAENRADDLWKSFYSPAAFAIGESSARVTADEALVFAAAGAVSSPRARHQLAIRPPRDDRAPPGTTARLLDADSTVSGALHSSTQFSNFLGETLPRGDLTRVQRALMLARLELVAAADRAARTPPADAKTAERAWGHIQADLKAMLDLAEAGQRSSRAASSASASTSAALRAEPRRHAADAAIRVLSSQPGQPHLYDDLGAAAAATAAEGRRWLEADRERADPARASSGAEERRRYDWLRLRHDTDAALRAKAQEQSYAEFLVSDDRARMQLQQHPAQHASGPATPVVPFRGDAVGGSASVARQMREAFSPGLAVPLAARRVALAFEEMQATS